MHRDRIVGVLTTILGAAVAYMTSQLAGTNMPGDPGPKVFPYICAGILLVCGLILTIRKPAGEAKPFQRFCVQTADSSDQEGKSDMDAPFWRPEFVDRSRRPGNWNSSFLVRMSGKSYGYRSSHRKKCPTSPDRIAVSFCHIRFSSVPGKRPCFFGYSGNYMARKPSFSVRFSNPPELFPRGWPWYCPGF